MLAGEMLAFLEADGTLRLNMGIYVGAADPNYRQIQTSEINENYVVEHVSGSPDDPGGETVKVTAFAVNETHSGVKRIFADAGDGDDSINLTDTLAPSELHGGQGSDVLTTGHGASSLFGDEGNDFFFVGSGDLNLQGHVIIDGGDDSDRVQVNDDGASNTLLVDYLVTPTSVTSTNSADAPSGQAPGPSADWTSIALLNSCGSTPPTNVTPSWCNPASTRSSISTAIIPCRARLIPIRVTTFSSTLPAQRGGS